MSDREIKKTVSNTFDIASQGYDLPELGFFKISADQLTVIAEIRGDEKILDVCTGTGHAAFSLSEKLTTGTVTGIDLSEKMIEAAKNKIAGKAGINFVCSDLDNFYMEEKFDIITCAFGIFFFPDMQKALGRMKSLLKQNGKIVLSSFELPFMEPQRGFLIDRLNKYGVQTKPSPWLNINTEDKLTKFLEENNFRKINIVRNECGYFLSDAEKWWNIITYTNFRNNLHGLNGDILDKFRREHLEEVENLKVADKGIYLDVKVMYAVCTI